MVGLSITSLEIRETEVENNDPFVGEKVKADKKFHDLPCRFRFRLIAEFVKNAETENVAMMQRSSAAFPFIPQPVPNPGRFA